MKKLILLLLIALTFATAIPSVSSARPVVVRRPVVVARPFIVDPFFPFFSFNFGFVVR